MFMSDEDKRLMKVSEFALHVNQKPDTIRKKIKEHKIPIIRVGIRGSIRIDPSFLDKYSVPEITR